MVLTANLTDKMAVMASRGEAPGDHGGCGMITYFRYVPHAQVADYTARGWTATYALDGTSHGQWSVLMQWEGFGEPA